MPRLLTKSRFKLALECPTKLFYTKKPQTFADNSLDDTFLQALAEGGFQVGELAKSYFPGGYDIQTLDEKEAVAQTSELLNANEVTIFEAAVRFENLFVRVDVLRKQGNRLELTEVKAKSVDSSEIEPFEGARGGITSTWKPYLYDVAFQQFVVASAFPEYEVKAGLMLADKSVACPTDGLHQKFAIVDDGGRKGARKIADLSAEELANPILVRINVDRLCEQLRNEPIAAIEGPTGFKERIAWLSGCYDRDEKIVSRPSTACASCQFKASQDDEAQGRRSGFKECWTAAFGWNDEDFNRPTVLDIWNYRGKATLLEDGKARIDEVDETDIGPRADGKPGLSNSERQWLQIQKSTARDNSVHIDRNGLRREMARWEFPLNFIDFETATPAIPFNRGRHPYETIAFQFSHHIVHEDGRVEHAGEYLNTVRGEFPNYAFIRKLRDALAGNTGSVFRYADHENTVLNAIHRQLQAESDAADDRSGLLKFIESISHSRRNSVQTWRGDRDMIDLRDLVKRYYYAPSTGGSNSIKHVLPAILNDSAFLKEKYSRPIYGAAEGIPSHNFKDMTWFALDGDSATDPYRLLPKLIESASDSDLVKVDDGEVVRDGGAAMAAYARMQFEDMAEAERRLTEKALLQYCELDTLAMVMIYEGWRSEAAT